MRHQTKSLNQMITEENLSSIIHRMKILQFKDDVHSVLRISSAHNKGGPPEINIAQILYLSNFFELKRIVYINLQV
jgi:hypothetical protein